MSNEIFFTSDMHFGHKSILNFEAIARPFSCVEEMHDVMVDRWNSVVTSQDMVYCLGDVCFGDSSFNVLGRLNGTKKLIMGNHDQHNVKRYQQFFTKVYGVKFWHNCVLSHIPVHPNCLGHRAALNVHGHLHSNFIDDPRYFNVCVEHHNLTPVHRSVLDAKVEELLK